MHEVMKLERAAIERWRKGDPDGFFELYAPDVTYFEPEFDRRLEGRSAIKEFLGGIRGRVIYSGSRFLHPHVQTFGTCAVLSYNYVSSGEQTPAGTDSTTTWNCTEVYDKSRGSWQILHNHWSYTLARKPEEWRVSGTTFLMPPGKKSPLLPFLLLEDAAMERWRRGDPDGFLELSARGVTYFDPDQKRRVDGRDRLKKVYDAIRGKVHYDGSLYIDPLVQVRGRCAVLTFNYISGRRGQDGELAPGTFWHTTEVYARRGESWKLVHTHWSYVGGRPHL